MLGRGIALLSGALLLSGCMTAKVGTDYAAISQKIGPPKPGQSRVVVLQQKRDGLSMAICACDVKVDGSPMGKVMVGTYAYADLPAGPHQLVASETLFPGDTKRDFTTAFGRRELEPADEGLDRRFSGRAPADVTAEWREAVAHLCLIRRAVIHDAERRKRLQSVPAAEGAGR